MIRALSEPLVLFTIPFGLYAGFLLVQLINPLAMDQWTRRVIMALAMTGTVMALGGLILTGVLAPRYEGGYRPAHIEDGRIVPGRMR